MPSAEFYNPNRDKPSVRIAVAVGAAALALIGLVGVPAVNRVQQQAVFGQEQVQQHLPAAKNIANEFLTHSYQGGYLAVGKVVSEHCEEKSWIEVLTALRDCKVRANGVYNVADLPSFLDEVDRTLTNTGTGLVGSLPETLPVNEYQPVEVQYVTGYEGDDQNRTRSTWRAEIACGTGKTTGKAVCRLSLDWNFSYAAPSDPELQNS